MRLSVSLMRFAASILIMHSKCILFTNRCPSNTFPHVLQLHISSSAAMARPHACKYIAMNTQRASTRKQNVTLKQNDVQDSDAALALQVEDATSIAPIVLRRTGIKALFEQALHCEMCWNAKSMPGVDASAAAATSRLHQACPGSSRCSASCDDDHAAQRRIAGGCLPRSFCV